MVPCNYTLKIPVGRGGVWQRGTLGKYDYNNKKSHTLQQVYSSCQKYPSHHRLVLHRVSMAVKMALASKTSGCGCTRERVFKSFKYSTAQHMFLLHSYLRIKVNKKKHEFVREVGVSSTIQWV